MSLACLVSKSEYFAAKYLLAAVIPSNAFIKLSEIWVYFSLECSHFYLFFYSFLNSSISKEDSAFTIPNSLSSTSIIIFDPLYQFINQAKNN